MRGEAVVIDAAGLLDLMVARDVGIRLDLRLEGCLLHAPSHIDAEVVAGLGRLEREGVLGRYRALDLLEALRDAPIERHPIPALLAGAWERRHDLGLGDALYLELARSLGLTLITTDPNLALATNPAAELVGGG
jgi:predicted nucleic acid-binding protein